MLDALWTLKTAQDKLIILKQEVSEHWEHLVQTTSIADVFLMLLGYVSKTFFKMILSSLPSSYSEKKTKQLECTF